MSTTDSKFPFFITTPVRDLTDLERATVLRLLESGEPEYREQVPRLRVVGHCGCGQCPTVFFEKNEPGTHEQDLCTYTGTDKEGGVVAAVLLQKHGQLSQLEYYSVDGHDPWYPPMAQDLRPYV
jgi:hypothetical protein